MVVLSIISTVGILGILPAHAVSPNSAKSVLRCQGLLPATPNCNSTLLTPFETVVYDTAHSGLYAAVDPILVGPTPAIGAGLKNDPKILYRDTNQNGHWDNGEPVFYNTNNTVAGRVFLYGAPTIRTDHVTTDPLIRFVDANGNGVLDGVVAITARLEDLGGLLPGGTQQDVPTIEEVFTYDHTLLQAMRTTYPGGGVLSGQFDAWCVTNSLTCNPGAGKYTYLVDNYCVSAGGSTFDVLTADDSAGKIFSSSFCGATGSYDYGLGCDPATRNSTLVGTCPGDITNNGIGALSNLDVLRVQFMVLGTGSTEINQVPSTPGVSGTLLGDVDGALSTTVPVALFNTTFSNTLSVSPVAKFTFTPSAPLINQTVNFDATLSVDPNGLPLTYQWSFGDGSTGTGVTVAHNYTAQGGYVAQLTVTNSNGASDSVSKLVLVTRIPYVAGVSVGQWATFTASGNSSFAQNILLATLNVTQVQSTNVTFTSKVLYLNGTTIQMTNTTDVRTFNLLFIPANLKANDIVASQFGLAGATINATVTGTFVGATRQANQLIISQRLPFPEYISAEWDQATGVLLDLNATLPIGIGQAGTERIKMVDTNIWLATQNKLPISVFNWTPLVPVVGQSVSFDASHSYDPNTGGHIVSYHWNFGDRSSADTTTPQTSHGYSAVGKYNATLTVTNNLGGTANFTRAIVVGIHDVAVTHISLPTQQITIGQTTNIGVTVSDLGSFNENVTVTVLVGTQTISIPQTVKLNGGVASTLSFSWDTTTFQPGDYMVKAAALEVPGEAILSNNNLTAGPVTLVLGPPSATLLAIPESGATPLVVIFTASAAGGLPPYTYAWLTPNASPTSGSGATITVTYSTAGTFTASVTVTDAAGHTDTKTASIMVSVGTGSLKIVVKDSAGNPVSGAAVQLNSGPTGQTLPGTFYTTSDGSVLFTSLKPGDYSYQVTIAGYQTYTGTAGVTSGPAQSSTASLSAVQQSASNNVNYEIYSGIAAALIIVILVTVLALRRRKSSVAQ